MVKVKGDGQGLDLFDKQANHHQHSISSSMDA